MSSRKKGSLKIKISSMSERAISIAQQFAREHQISFERAVNRLVMQAERQRLAAVEAQSAKKA